MFKGLVYFDQKKLDTFGEGEETLDTKREVPRVVVLERLMLLRCSI